MSTGVVIRRMRWWDVEQAVVLERELFPDAWSAEGLWGELAGWPLTRHYVVAQDERGVIGYAGVMVTAGDADVQTLAVSATAQGQGIGRLLLGDLVAAATRRGCEALLLEVRADNAPAVRLYERAGFQHISTRRGYYDGGRTDARVMRLLLEDSHGR